MLFLLSFISIFRECINSSSYSCRAISSAQTSPIITSDCVEGCACPPGSALSAAGGCVPVAACPCWRGESAAVAAGPVDNRTDRGEGCTCQAAQWHCRYSIEEFSNRTKNKSRYWTYDILPPKVVDPDTVRTARWIRILNSRWFGKFNMIKRK